MQKRHDFNVLTMELHLPCIKPPELYVNSSRETAGHQWNFLTEG